MIALTAGIKMKGRAVPSTGFYGFLAAMNKLVHEVSFPLSLVEVEG